MLLDTTRRRGGGAGLPATGPSPPPDPAIGRPSRRPQQGAPVTLPTARGAPSGSHEAAQAAGGAAWIFVLVKMGDGLAKQEVGTSMEKNAALTFAVRVRPGLS